MTTSPTYLHILAILAGMICSFFYMQTTYLYWNPKYNKFAFSIMTALIVGTLNWVSLFFDNAIFSFILAFLAEAILLHIGSHVTNVQAIFAATSSSLLAMCLKGIVVGTAALLMRKNMYQIITVSNWNLYTFIAIMVCKTSVLQFYRHESTQRSLPVLLRTAKELEAVVMQHGALFVFMLFYSYNYYYNLDLLWFSFAQIILSILILILYFLILRYGIRVSNLTEGELLSERIQQQMNAQLAQYESYRTILTQVEDFKYHFRESMIGMDELLSRGETLIVQQKIQEIYPTLIDKLPTKKTYSNNEQLNALLFNWDNHVQKHHIKFESTVYFPPTFDGKVNDILSAFTILEEMFIQLVQDSKNPQIKISGKEIHRNFTISISGSILGYIEERYELPYFIMPNAPKIKSLYHKLVSVSATMNATLFWNYTDETSIFQIVMSVRP